MIGLKKVPLQNLGRRKIVNFDAFTLHDETGSGRLLGRYSQNCDCTDGAIARGIGLTPYKTPSGTELGLGATSEVKMLFPLYASDGVGNSLENFFVLYQLEDKTYARRYDDALSAWGSPSTYSLDAAGVYALNADGGVVSLILSKDGCKYQSTEGFYLSKGYRKSSGIACYCQNRVFVVTGDREITYSDPAEPTKITKEENDGGTILRPLDGDKIVGLLAKESFVYVFYRHSIVKIEVTGQPKSFLVRPLTYAGGEIYGKTAVLCGAWIVFLAADGLYRFDGDKAERICEWLGVKSATENQAFGRGRYLSNALISYMDEDGELCTVAVNPEKKEGYFVTPLRALTECNGRSLCMLGNKIMQLDDPGETPQGESCFFETKEIDFGDKEKKTLQALRFKGKGSVTLQVFCDGKEKECALEFVDGEASCSPTLRGKKFCFRFTLEKDARIESMAAEVLFLNAR